MVVVFSVIYNLLPARTSAPKTTPNIVGQSSKPKSKDRQVDAYIATINDDQALREKTAKLWSELNHAPILPEHINCQGCRVNGAKTVYCESLCGIRQCALQKGVTTCGDCPELESCQTVGAILSNNPAALENLKG